MTKTKTLNKSQLSAALSELATVKFHTIHIPEISGHINVKVHNVREREAYEEVAFVVNKSKEPMRAVLFAHAVVDDEGNRLFSDDDIKDIAEYPSSVLVKVWDTYHRINGFTPQKVDEAEKNS